MSLAPLLESAPLVVVPFAVCELRGGVGVEVAPTEDAHLYCVLSGAGALCGEGLRVAVRVRTVVIVPAGYVHAFEPLDANRRRILLRAAPENGSDHLASVTAGDGAPALAFMAARLRASAALLDRLAPPRTIALDEVPQAHAVFAALREEQERCLPGRRSMSVLLLQAALIHALRVASREENET